MKKAKIIKNGNVNLQQVEVTLPQTPFFKVDKIYTKEQVIMLVADFDMNYNGGKAKGTNLEQHMKDIENYINWDIIK